MSQKANVAREAGRFDKVIGEWAGREIDLSRPMVFDDRELLLTFDDGPTKATRDNLDTLGTFGLSAVFFMIGQLADRHPEIVREAAARGHLIGSHTFSHPELRELLFDTALQDIEDGHEALINALAPAQPAPLFRFPFLRDTVELRHAVEASGLRIVDIDIDTKDWSRRMALTNLYGCLRRIEKGGRGIVLLHDVRVTRDILPALLQVLGGRGFRFLRPVWGA